MHHKKWCITGKLYRIIYNDKYLFTSNDKRFWSFKYIHTLSKNWKDVAIYLVLLKSGSLLPYSKYVHGKFADWIRSVLKTRVSSGRDRRSCTCTVFQKPNITHPWRAFTWEYQGAKNVSFWENFVYVLDRQSRILFSSPF